MSGSRNDYARGGVKYAPGARVTKRREASLESRYGIVPNRAGG